MSETPPPGHRVRGPATEAFGALLGAPPALPAGAVPVALPVERFAVALHGVLSPAECAAVIAETERRGHGMALLNIGGGREVEAPGVRDSARVIIDSPEFADALFARVAAALPPEQRLGGGFTWRLVGLNERLRLLRYDAGQHFAPHFDGCFVRGAEAGALQGQRTFITLLLYLNEEYSGCETSFYDDDDGGATPVAPHTGLVLMHAHRIRHVAPPLRSGRKYVMRTDVLYEQV